MKCKHLPHEFLESAPVPSGAFGLLILILILIFLLTFFQKFANFTRVLDKISNGLKTNILEKKGRLTLV